MKEVIYCYPSGLGLEVGLEVGAAVNRLVGLLLPIK